MFRRSSAVTATATSFAARSLLPAALTLGALGAVGLGACGDDADPRDASTIDGTSDDDAHHPPADAATDAPDAPPPIDATDAPPLPDASAACNSEVVGFPLAQAAHITLCSDVTYDTNPPTSGAHYPTWAAYKTYTTPVRQPFLVHNLEHGAVIIHYNCGDTPCDEELAALADFLAARPADTICSPPVTHRIIVTPDPDLDVRFAAASWGYALRSNCFDLAALDAFLTEHYADAPENLCGDGLDVGIPGNNCD
jgi:hypothetical protein